MKHFEAAQAKGDKVAGQAIRDLVTVNGVRVTVEDGTWGLVRASSNKPELVVVVESPVSEAAHARHVRGDGRCCAPIPKSASTIRRSEGGSVATVLVIGERGRVRCGCGPRSVSALRGSDLAAETCRSP